jgi:glycerophosphoryl diester phosphodiesterase
MKKPQFVFCLLITLLVFSCDYFKNESERKNSPIIKQYIDIQGHRGCRGLMPENSIPAFIKAIELGVTTLEMDVVISADKKVVVSHEPWLSHEICISADSLDISEEDEKHFNLYEMNYDEIAKCDCGSKYQKLYPQQEHFFAAKPLLNDVIDSVEAITSNVIYNIEIKTTPKGDNNYHPDPQEFSNLLLALIDEKNITSRVTIQSFDFRPLQYIRNIRPDISLALLAENKSSAQENIKALGFIPDIYSPAYTQVNEELIEFAEVYKIRIIPWTVNDTSDIGKLLLMGVDGIITDYPDRAIATVNSYLTRYSTQE